MSAARPGELRIGRTLGAALGVVRRRWPAIVGLALLLDAAPDVAIWLVNGYRYPEGHELSAPLHAALLGFHIATGGIVAATMARVVLADQLSGQGLTPGAALAVGWARLPDIVFAWFLISLATSAVDFLPDQRSLARQWGAIFLATAVWSVSAALFSTTAAALVHEDLPATRAVLRAFRLTAGFRGKLIGAYLILSFVQLAILLVTIQAVSYGWYAATGDAGSAGGVGAAAYTIIYRLWMLFFVVWSPVLYLALRKAAEGLGAEEAEVFA